MTRLPLWTVLLCGCDTWWVHFGALPDLGDTGDADCWELGDRFPDADGDGYGDDDDAMSACDAPSDATELGGDCDDTDASVSPSAGEICNGIDDDCDGAVDDEDPDVDASSGGLVWYTDADSDGYGLRGTGTWFCDPPGEGWSRSFRDCDDDDAEVNPGALEVPGDGIDNNCDGCPGSDQSEAAWYADEDGDGWGDDATAHECADGETGVAWGGDCDDADASVYHPLDCDADLLLYLQFDEGEGTSTFSAVDETEGTIEGATWAAGHDGRALEFDGVDDYVDFGDILDDLTLPLTACAWIWMDEDAESDHVQVIYASDDSSEGQYYGAWLYVDPGVMNAGLHTSFCDGGWAVSASRRSMFTDDLPDSGSWVHVCSTMSGPLDMVSYIDGEDGGAHYTGSGDDMEQSSDPFVVGKRTVHDQYFMGRIDELRIYGRALDEDEVNELLER